MLWPRYPLIEALRAELGLGGGDDGGGEVLGVDQVAVGGVRRLPDRRVPVVATFGSPPPGEEEAGVLGEALGDLDAVLVEPEADRFLAEAVVHDAGGGDCERQRVQSGARTEGQDVPELVVGMRVELVDDDAGRIQALFGGRFGREHPVDRARGRVVR